MIKLALEVCTLPPPLEMRLETSGSSIAGLTGFCHPPLMMADVQARGFQTYYWHEKATQDRDPIHQTYAYTLIVPTLLNWRVLPEWLDQQTQEQLVIEVNLAEAQKLILVQLGHPYDTYVVPMQSFAERLARRHGSYQALCDKENAALHAWYRGMFGVDWFARLWDIHEGPTEEEVETEEVYEVSDVVGHLSVVSTVSHTYGSWNDVLISQPTSTPTSVTVTHIKTYSSGVSSWHESSSPSRSSSFISTPIGSPWSLSSGSSFGGNPFYTPRRITSTSPDNRVVSSAELAMLRAEAAANPPQWASPARLSVQAEQWLLPAVRAGAQFMNKVVDDTPCPKRVMKVDERQVDVDLMLRRAVC